jgi:hypothetical protein
LQEIVDDLARELGRLLASSGDEDVMRRARS